jgi:hypothetical protein
LHPRPIFILGHWRCGTTFLHHLLALDDRHKAPTAWECFAPHISLLLGHWFPRWFLRVVPRKRYMDGLPFAWGDPQEDEFALCNLGLPSPYGIIAYPNGRQTIQEFRAEIERADAHASLWRRGFKRFLQQVSYRRPGRLILKSPTHTCRVSHLLEMFPDALFVHIVREPEKVFRSTEKMWRELTAGQSIQRPAESDLSQFVIDTFNYVHARLDRDTPNIPDRHWMVIRYEDLRQNPLEQIQAIYERFELGEFQRVVPKLQAYLDAHSDVRLNSYQGLTTEERRRLSTEWGWYVQRYNYA